MALFIFLLHLALCTYHYLKEKTFGIASVYVLGLVVFYFLPAGLNQFVYPNFALLVPVELAWLAGSVAIFSMRLRMDAVEQFIRYPLSPRKVQRIRIGVILLILLILLYGVLTDGAALRMFTNIIFSVICLWGVYAYRNRKRYTYRWFTFAALAVLCFIIFYTLLWTGFGRMMLARFVITGFIFASLCLRRVRLLKIVGLLSLPVFIFIAGVLRDREATLQTAFAEGEGIKSILSPMMFTSELYKDMRDNRLEPLYGESYVATALFFVPRALWPGKPPGFGRAMVPWYTPTVRHPGHSLAGTHIGEAIGNFKLFGLVLGPFLLWLYFRLIQYALCTKRPRRFVPQVVWIIIGISLLNSVSDFLWAGTFTPISRTVIGLVQACPFILLLVAVRIGSPAARAVEQSPPATSSLR